MQPPIQLPTCAKSWHMLIKRCCRFIAKSVWGARFRRGAASDAPTTVIAWRTINSSISHHANSVRRAISSVLFGWHPSKRLHAGAFQCVTRIYWPACNDAGVKNRAPHASPLPPSLHGAPSTHPFHTMPTRCAAQSLRGIGMTPIKEIARRSFSMRYPHLLAGMQ
jgi:hypothetical protein